MRLQQLRYVIAIAESGSINAVAHSMFAVIALRVGEGARTGDGHHHLQPLEPGHLAHE